LFPAVKKGCSKSGKDYDALDKVLFIPASYNENIQKALDQFDSGEAL
jgi:hypothetical protein